MSEEQLSLSDYLYSLERFERDLYRYQIETGDLFGRKDKTFLQRRNECFKQIVANYGNVDALRAENERLREAAKGLITALPEIAFELGIGWTNLGTIKRRREEMIQALNEVKE